MIVLANAGRFLQFVRESQILTSTLIYLVRGAPSMSSVSRNKEKLTYASARTSGRSLWWKTHGTGHLIIQMSTSIARMLTAVSVVNLMSAKVKGKIKRRKKWIKQWHLGRVRRVCTISRSCLLLVNMMGHQNLTKMGIVNRFIKGYILDRQKTTIATNVIEMYGLMMPRKGKSIEWMIIWEEDTQQIEKDLKWIQMLLTLLMILVRIVNAPKLPNFKQQDLKMTALRI